MKQKTFLRLLLTAIMCCLAFASQAATVNIEGYTSSGTYNGYPLYVVTSSPITVSSSAGSFNCIDIDGYDVVYGSYYWSSRSLNIGSYLDGEPHKLKLESGSSNYGICYFQSFVDMLIDGLYYKVGGSSASVVGCSTAVENAVILDEYVLNGTRYPVTKIQTKLFADARN